MISDNQSICPKCGGQLKYYDHVQRLVRTKFGNKKWVAIRRLRCCKCHAVHRELPDFIFPYKQYEADIIIGVLEGLITCETFGFEDYPCEMTMIRWRLFPPRLFLLTAVPNLKQRLKDLLTKVKQKFQVLGAAKKATQNQAAEQLKIETAASQMVQRREISRVPGNPNRLSQKRSRYARTCWRMPSCRHGMACPQSVSCS